MFDVARAILELELFNSDWAHSAILNVMRHVKVPYDVKNINFSHNVGEVTISWNGLYDVQANVEFAEHVAEIVNRFHHFHGILYLVDNEGKERTWKTFSNV